MKQYLLILCILLVNVQGYSLGCGYNDYKNNDNVIVLCVTDNYDADADEPHYIKFNYLSTNGETITTDWLNMDNEDCDDFVRDECNYFDVVPSDIAKVNYVDIGA